MPEGCLEKIIKLLLSTVISVIFAGVNPVIILLTVIVHPILVLFFLFGIAVNQQHLLPIQ